MKTKGAKAMRITLLFFLLGISVFFIILAIKQVSKKNVESQVLDTELGITNKNELNELFFY